MSGSASRGAAPSDRPVVAVYREKLLRYNETYIRAQGETLTRYQAYYVGAHRVRGLDLPPERTLVLREHYRGVDRALDPIMTRVPRRGVGRAMSPGSVVGRVSEVAFKVLGVSPPFVRALRKIAPRLIHAHTGVSGSQALPLARRLGLPLVVTYHGYETTASDAELHRWPVHGRVFLRRREAMKREVDRFVVVSKFLRDRVLAQGYPEARIVLHYIGVDTEFFTSEGATPLADRDPIIFFAGRLIEKKGTEYLIAAMREVQERAPRAEVVIAGEGDRRQSLERKARELNVRVRFLGRVTPAEVRDWLARAQVYCMPSVRAAAGDAEGVPIALQEAMSCGLPIVATTSAGIPEVVVDGETGYLVPERDPAALAGRLSALLTDTGLLARMGAAARGRVLENFDLRRQTARLETIYDEARAEHADRPRRAAAGA